MVKTVGTYKIPFRDGNQLSYPETWRSDYEMVDNFEFTDTLTYQDFYRGRSAAGFEFIKKSDGKTVSMFMKDFTDAIPLMIEGRLTGRFTFVKRGQNFGCTMIKE